MEKELKTCISGSFKFKPEIDLLIEEFNDLGVTVLSPEKGWLYIPKYRILKPEFRPLPLERNMSIKTIEDNFLIGINQSDFLYVASFEGYIGESTSMEIGFAFAKQIPVYSIQKIINIENDLWFGEVLNRIKVKSPSEVIKETKQES